MKEDIYHRPITKHGGSKYVRLISALAGTPSEGQAIHVDVYSVLVAFGVTCPATAHAIKKLLCAGLRNKGDRLDDLKGAMDALFRAIEEEEATDLYLLKGGIQPTSPDPPAIGSVIGSHRPGVDRYRVTEDSKKQLLGVPATNQITSAGMTPDGENLPYQ